MSGFGSLITFETGSLEKANAVLRRLKSLYRGRIAGRCGDSDFSPRHHDPRSPGRSKAGPKLALQTAWCASLLGLKMPMICCATWTRASACCRRMVKSGVISTARIRCARRRSPRHERSSRRYHDSSPSIHLPSRKSRSNSGRRSATSPPVRLLPTFCAGMKPASFRSRSSRSWARWA